MSAGKDKKRGPPLLKQQGGPKRQVDFVAVSFYSLSLGHFVAK